MNRQELIEAIVKDTGVSKADADRVLRSTIDNIQKAVKKNKKVTLVGFGTFELRKLKARNGVKPSTGEKIKIAARKKPAFRAGASFKELVNK